MLCPACKAANQDDTDICFKCGQGLFAVTEGTLLSGRYRILSPIGRGGMGSVYRAHDQTLDEIVALKVLRGELARSPAVARRFRSEIKLARRVRHPNVCAIHEYGEDGHLRFITMEHVEGVDLRKEVHDRGRLPVAEAFEVAAQIGDGLQAIHSVGIVHRDLKTANVMRDRGGRVKVMDFGLAKRLEGGTAAETSAGLILGTPSYMSPEQARGEKIDFRSDIYALGVVVFELFSGELPFTGETPQTILMAHLSTPPPVAGPGATAFPPALVPVLQKALAKSPQDRYCSAREMGEALAAARARVLGARGARPAPTEVPPTSAGSGVLANTLTETPTETNIGSFPREAASPPSSRRWTWAFAAVLLAALAAGVGMLYRAGRAKPSAAAVPALSTVATAPRESLAPTPAAAPVEEAVTVVSRPAESPAPRAVSLPRPVPTPAPIVPAATVRPAPPAPSPAPATPSAPPRASAPPAAFVGTGQLSLWVKPWAEVAVDGSIAGTTPLKPIDLPAGVHQVVLTHPAYEPLSRTVTIKPGQTTQLDVNLKWEAVLKKDR